MRRNTEKLAEIGHLLFESLGEAINEMPLLFGGKAVAFSCWGSTVWRIAFPERANFLRPGFFRDIESGSVIIRSKKLIWLLWIGLQWQPIAVQIWWDVSSASHDDNNNGVFSSIILGKKSPKESIGDPKSWVRNNNCGMSPKSLQREDNTMSVTVTFFRMFVVFSLLKWTESSQKVALASRVDKVDLKISVIFIPHKILIWNTPGLSFPFLRKSLELPEGNKSESKI